MQGAGTSGYVNIAYFMAASLALYCGYSLHTAAHQARGTPGGAPLRGARPEELIFIVGRDAEPSDVPSDGGPGRGGGGGSAGLGGGKRAGGNYKAGTGDEEEYEEVALEDGFEGGQGVSRSSGWQPHSDSLTGGIPDLEREGPI